MFKNRIVLAISIPTAAVITWIVFLYKRLSERAMSVDVLVGTVLLISVVAAVVAYLWSRNRDVLNVSVARREEFIKNQDFQDIRMRIEHNDIELQTIIATLNVAPKPYDPKVLPTHKWQLHEKFDDYLNYLEGVALLYKKGYVTKEELEGLWSYYFARLRKVHTLTFTEPHHPKKAEILECSASFYGGNIPTQIEELWSRDNYKEIPDPIIGEVCAGHNKYKKINEGLKDEDRNKKINPIERPIWYYTNYGDYKFTAIIELLRQLYLQIDIETEEKNLSLLADGIK